MAFPADDLRTRLSQTAHDELLAFIPAGADMNRIRTHILHGSPWDQIVEFARDKQVDLIVMGTHGRTGIGHALIGSVAERVLRRAPCPVMVIREGGAGFHVKEAETAGETRR
jgi:nucleotide-binding universal stress UspA family protein